MTRALALIDGEHYPEVVRDALAELPYEFVAACLVGGTEKLRGGDEDYGVPLVRGVEDAVDEYAPDVVVDLSDEPVLGPVERFRTASRVLALGVPYEGADFRLEPPDLAPVAKPSLAVIGTGKRMGKTAVTAQTARILGAEHDLVVVAMGRGGPPEPDLVEEPPTPQALLERSRAGRHAASDYLEIAALAGVPTIGCRRCGGGLAGTVSTTNLDAGLGLLAERDPDLVIFDGSGAAIPPVATDKRILVVGAQQAPELVTGYLNAYRILVSDLVVLTMAEDGSRHEELKRAIADVKPSVTCIATILRPRPVEPVAGKRVAFFSTAPATVHERLAAHLCGAHGAADVRVSGNLSNRDALRDDLERLDADVYLIEIKAAAIDVVAEAADERGIEVVFADTELHPLPGEPDLEAELRQLAASATAEPVRG